MGEILRIYPGWAPEDFARFKNMMSTYLYPVCHDFLVRHNNSCDTHYWANWDLCNLSAILSIGVLCDDRDKFNEAIAYFENGVGNGNIWRVVATIHPDGLGQWQESGRDQEHAQLGVGLLGAMCEVAWNQGVDLYGYAGNRILAGAEYVARTNLSLSVPYAPYNNCDNVNQYYLSGNGIGRIDDRPLWEMIYNHYVGRLGLSAPNVKAMAEVTRPERGSADHFGYGTLTFTRTAALSPYPPAPVPPAVSDLTATAGVSRVMLDWSAPAAATAQGYRVLRSTTAGGPYSTLASWSANTWPHYTDTSVTNGTTYYYVVEPVNQSGTGAASGEVSATPAAAGVLADGWAHGDIGAVNSSGASLYAAASNQTFIVTGNGATIGGTADAAGYAYRTVTGDCTLVARLVANGTKGGLMIRESLDAGARTLSLALGDVGGRQTRFGTRATPGAAMSFQAGNDYTWWGVWYRLQRSGDTFTAAQSADGVSWHTIGTSNVPMGATCLVGLVACGTITMDNVTATGEFLAGPPRALTAVNGHGQISLSWLPSAGATSYTLKRASSSGGPYSVLAAGLTGTSQVDAPLVDGTTCYYVVTASQGDFETVPSNEAFGTAGDITRMWKASPGSGAWSTAANWVDSAPPEAGDSVAFAASSITSLTNDLAGLAVNRITFGGGAPGYTLGGNALTVGGGILNSAVSSQTIALPLLLSGTRTITTASGNIVVTGVVSDAVVGSGIEKLGGQTLSLTAANTFTGDVRLAAGRISIAGIGAGTAGAPVSGALGRGTLRLAGGTLTSSASARVYNNVVVEAGTTSFLSSASANLTLAGNISGGGTISESGSNTGGTHLNGDNSGFTGTFTSSHNASHRIRFNSPDAGSAAATWILNNAPTDGNGFAFPAGSGTIHFGALSGGGVFRNNAVGTVTMRIGALNASTTFTGVIVQNGTRVIAVDKVGEGTLTFTGNHSYNGTTTVTSGAFYVNGGLASAVTANGGTFGGRGSSNAAVTIRAGATFAPGSPGTNDGIGTFTTAGALAVQDGATFAVQLNSSTGTADKAVASSVSLAGATLDIQDVGTMALPAGTTFRIVDNAGASAVSGVFAGLPEGTLFAVGANQFRITYVGGTGNDVELTAIVQATLVLSGLTQTFDGAPKAVTVTTSPAGVPVQVSYAGDTPPPTNAGSYAVVATVADPNYLGSIAGTLVIEKAVAAIEVANLTQTYDGAPKPVGVSTVPAGLPVNVTYDGASAAPIDAGTYAVGITVNDANYAGAAERTLTIEKAAAQIALANLQQHYDGTPKTVTISTVPAGLAVAVSYDGAAAAPVYPGSHAVLATVEDRNFAASAQGTLAITITGLVRRMPTIDGTLAGSVQVVADESVSLNSQAVVSGDLLVAGMPQLQVNGDAVYAGVKDGPGGVAPASFMVTLNRGAVLRYLVRRIDPLALPVVPAPEIPSGTRDVVLSKAGDELGDPSTLLNLTLGAKAGAVAIPPGSYGVFTLNAGSVLVLGVVGATEPARYDLQSLTMNANTRIELAGPVQLTLSQAPTVDGRLGQPTVPEWLTLRVAAGGLTLNHGAEVHGVVVAPTGSVTLNGALRGRVVAESLTLNAHGLLEETSR